MNAKNTSENIPDEPVKTNYSMIASSQTQENQNAPTNKMSKIDKIRLWAGVCFVVVVLAFVFGFLVVPRIIQPCSIFSSYSHIALCGGAYNFWLLISFFLGIPLNIIGEAFILTSISNWKKIKHPEPAIFLIVILNISLFIYLITLIK